MSATRIRRTVVGGPMTRHLLTLEHVSPVPLAELTADDITALTRDADSARRSSPPRGASRITCSSARTARCARAGRVHRRGRAAARRQRRHSARCSATTSALLEHDVRAHLNLKKLPALVLASSAAPLPAAVPMLEADALALQADLMARQRRARGRHSKLARALTLDPGHLGAQVARVRQRLAQQQVP